MATGRSGILLLNLGGPETLDDVQPFLYNLFADPDLIRLPWPRLQPFIATAISTLRAKKSKANYAVMGGGSPLRRITDEQAQALQSCLVTRGLDVPVYVAMRYWHPFLSEVLPAVKAAKLDRLVLLPLYPQYSISTTGSSFKEIQRAWAEDPQLQSVELVMINSWYDQPHYVDAMAAGITAELEQFEDPEKVCVMFSAHGIPQSYVTKAGDPYQQEMEACVKLIWQQVRRSNRCVLSYQSRVGSVQWLQPYTETIIPALAQEGVKQLLVVPISFISEHVETLQEIDIEYRELAEHHGIHVFRRVPALNTQPRFIEGLAELVRPHLTLPALQTGDPLASATNSVG